ncbi:hypothetical protein CHS0354_043167 [Potamilus streckersoni]|uniref:Uncharacterized protein n=1 Tax=Potamilus streckersoni TaxID=2493646 RepID=A0AAE0SN98_9BIVA|nr:hypothetical protein CHS0354_043167 [Potamilus streckersoni]
MANIQGRTGNLKIYDDQDLDFGTTHLIESGKDEDNVIVYTGLSLSQSESSTQEKSNRLSTGRPRIYSIQENMMSTIYPLQLDNTQNCFVDQDQRFSILLRWWSRHTVPDVYVINCCKNEIIV